ncbi:MAG: hypothetical protein SLAVMIC_00462 [uncultured marine phage]|uniref:Uncharacterized protein n=1 Tax=uncultured marine phage TaxID=707152 RepID=A0A8D9FQT3_9VIRU|nr:MAG: hypothetical protein SLAVMIC_00462 [uncultured marine phage]
MANFDQDTQRKTGFFHALGYVLTKDVNDPANEKYKSAHNVQTNEIWVDVINYVANFADAETEASSNSALNQNGDESSVPTSLALLYPLKDSNGQAWFLDSGSPVWSSTGFIPSSGWTKPLVSPVDVTDASGAPSTGLNFRLYTPSGSVISTLNGKWEVDYYGAFLKFNVGSTPFDSGNGLGFVVDFAALVSAPDKTVYLQSNGPRAVAFNYSGQFLDDLLANLSPSSGGGGSQEWQDSVKGYLITVGTDTTVNGATSTNDQVDYLIDTYEDFYIYTTTVDGGNTYSVSDDTYYKYNGTTFSVHVPVTTDDDNRYLKLENSITLDTVVQTGTSYSITYGDTVPSDRIIEYLGATAIGLTQNGWEITPPRIGMVTTMDDINNRRTRYTGSSNGWVEVLDESTFKVNTQKGMMCGYTNVEYDVAVDELVQFEPSGDKSIDVLVNGVEVYNDGYTFALPSVYTNITTYTVTGTNSLSIINAQAPTASQYLRFDIGTGYSYRKIVGATVSGLNTDITYSGYDVPAFSTLDKFSVTFRSDNIARKNDILLWKGTNFYDLDNEDLITFEYVTADVDAENL